MREEWSTGFFSDGLEFINDEGLTGSFARPFGPKRAFLKE